MSVAAENNDDAFMRLSDENRRIISAMSAKTNLNGVVGGYCEDGFPIYFADNSFVFMLGYDSYDDFSESIGRLADTVYSDDRERIENEINTYRNSGTEFITACRMSKKDGSYFWVKCNGAFTEAEDGRTAVVAVCTDITETMNVREELTNRNDFLIRQSQELKFINNDMPAGYYRCSPEPGYPFLFVSDIFLEMLGYTREELEELFDNSFLNMVYPDDRIIAENKFKDSENGGDFQVEYRMISKNGSIWVIDQKRIIENEQWRFFRGVIVDVTEIVELRNRIQLLIQYTPQDIVILNVKNGDVYFNVLANGLSRGYGVSAADFERELNSGAYYSRIDRFTEKQLRIQYDEALKNHTGYSRTFSMNNHIGKRVILHLDVSYIGEDNGCISYLCICNDVTDDKKKDKEIAITNKKLEMTLSLAGINSWEWNIEKHTLTITGTADDKVIERISGKRKTNPVVIDNFPLCFMKYDIIPQEYKQMLASFVQKAESETREFTVTFEMPFITVDNELIWLNINGKTICDSNGRAICVIGSYNNVTNGVQMRKRSNRDKKLFEIFKKVSSYKMQANLSKNAVYGSDGEKLDKSYDEFIKDFCRLNVHPDYHNAFSEFTDREVLIDEYAGKDIVRKTEYISTAADINSRIRLSVYISKPEQNGDIMGFFFSNTVN